MLTQNKILWTAGLAATAIGAYANLTAKGAKSALIFAAAFLLIVYLATFQVYCLIVGRCISSAWISAGIFLATFSGVAAVYLNIIKNKGAQLDNSSIYNTNPILGKTITYLEQGLNYRLLG